MKAEIEFSGYFQKFLLEGKPFYPKIFSKNSPCPEDFNSSSLFLDCSASASLHWETEKERAHILAKNGKFLFWNLNLGLAEEEGIDEMHFLSLEIAIEHFIKDIWKEFENVSLGVCLFEGKIGNLSENRLHDLKLLASRFPESVSCFLLLDTSEIENPFSFFDKTKGFGHFNLILKGDFPFKFPYAFPFLGWDLPSPLGFFSDQKLEILPEKKLAQALLLPKTLKFELDALSFLDKNMRVISETVLTNEWEGVDELIVFSETVDEKVRRKLLGFRAAGGEIVYIDNK